MSDPILSMLTDAAAGRWPPADGAVEVVAPGVGDDHLAVFGFNAHHVIVGDVSAGWIVEQLEDAPNGGAALVTLGVGYAGRREISIEVEPEARGRGVAAAALCEARRLLKPGEVVFAQAAPANAASIRALATAGFRPVGAEVLFFAEPDD